MIEIKELRAITRNSESYVTPMSNMAKSVLPDGTEPIAISTTPFAHLGDNFNMTFITDDAMYIIKAKAVRSPDSEVELITSRMIKPNAITSVIAHFEKNDEFLNIEIQLLDGDKILLGFGMNRDDYTENRKVFDTYTRSPMLTKYFSEHNESVKD